MKHCGFSPPTETVVRTVFVVKRMCPRRPLCPFHRSPKISVGKFRVSFPSCTAAPIIFMPDLNSSFSPSPPSLENQPGLHVASPCLAYLDPWTPCLDLRDTPPRFNFVCLPAPCRKVLGMCFTLGLNPHHPTNAPCQLTCKSWLSASAQAS